MPIVSLSYLAYYHAKLSTEDMITSHLVSIADLKKRELVSWVDQKIEETRMLATYPDIHSLVFDTSGVKIPKHLKEMSKLSKWESISLLTEDNRVISTSQTTVHSNITDSLKTTTLVKGEVLIAEHYQGHNNTPTIAFITPINLENSFSSEKTSYLILEIDLNTEIIPLINSWPGMGYTGETLIARQIENDIVFINRLRHMKDLEQNLRIPATSNNALPAIFASSGNEGVIRTTDYRGEEVLAVYRHISLLNWGFVAKIDQKEAFAPIKDLQNNALFATMIVLFFVSIVSALIANSIVNPLSYLEQMAKRFSSGDFSAKIDLDAKGEIGSLARTLEKMKNDLITLQLEALKNEKLAAIGKLSGSVAHDIRNPLGTISNSVFFLQALCDKMENEQIDKHLALMQSEINRVNSIINDLLDFSRENKPVLELNDLNLLLQQVLEKTRESDQIRYKRDLDTSLQPFLFDEIQMQRVFSNLVNNSIQAITADGEIRISTRLNQKQVEIQIQDNGKGITKEELEHTFEPLFTTKSKGVGLGLSITKTFIEKHNGRIRVTSQPEKGTSFFITLPYLKSH